MPYRDIDLSVRCPYCKAAAGRHCRKMAPAARHRMYMPKPHQARIHEANAKLAESSERPDG